MVFKLNLTRDQLATFLQNQEQIKQFENLFALADSIAPDIVQAATIQAGNAQASANEALAQIVSLAQSLAINSGTADQKAIQALDTIGRMANVLELLALAPRQEIGTIAAQNADNVKITGGVITGLDSPLPVDSGGTGQNIFTDGQLLIGNTTGNTLTKATLTQGANITITNGGGSITIAVSGLGSMAFQSTGASGSFTAASGETITVVNGIITSIV